jgi:hypothetical protein
MEQTLDLWANTAGWSGTWMFPLTRTSFPIYHSAHSALSVTLTVV